MGYKGDPPSYAACPVSLLGLVSKVSQVSFPSVVVSPQSVKEDLFVVFEEIIFPRPLRPVVTAGSPRRGIVLVSHEVDLSL